MNLAIMIMLGFLVVCAIAVSFTRNLLNSILIFMVYSVVMSVIWILVESPDLAITEAAVGAGVTSILFFLTLRHITRNQLNDREDKARKTLKDAGYELPDAYSDEDDAEWEAVDEAYDESFGIVRGESEDE